MGSLYLFTRDQGHDCVIIDIHHTSVSVTMSGCRQRTEGCQWLHVEHVFSHESLSALFTYNSLLLLTSALCLKYNSNKELDRNHTAAATFRFSRNVLQPVFPTSLFQANNCIHSRKINVIFHLVTTNFDLWPDRFKVNYHPKYLGQKSFRPKLIVWTHTHTHIKPIVYLDH